MKKNKKKTLMLSIFAIITVLLITVGVTYAFFNYTKEGTTDNTITTGTITFLYTEVSKVGRGISIEDAYPVSDSVGKVQTGEGKVFDFKVTSNTPNSSTIDYEVTSRKKDTSTLSEDAVKLYLTKVEGTSEEEVILSKYSELTPTTKVDSSRFNEKTLYKGKVPANTSDFEQAFRLRMWIDEDVDFSDGSMNDKEFTVTVNVYANAKVVTEEDIENQSKAEISSLSVNGTELTKVTNNSYDYKISLPEGTTSATINIETESEYAKVSVEKLDSLAVGSSVKKLSTKKTLNLVNGKNYFKITVTSEDGTVTNDFILRISVGEVANDSILGYVGEESFVNDTITEITANGKVYSAHVYEFDGDQVWSENKTFGDKNDVATETEYAKNMVVVKVNGDLTINSGVTVAPYYTEYGGPKGFLLYVTGTLTNNGTIDNSHGAKAVGEDVYLWQNDDDNYEYVPAVGALGGEANSMAASKCDTDGSGIGIGANGYNATGRQTGGGGSGGNSCQNLNSVSGIRASGAGATGTSYSGGGGGAAIVGNVSCQEQPASPNGGRGGDVICDAYTSYGGVGNPGGYGTSSEYNGASGTGGLLIIYANNISGSGLFSANGTDNYDSLGMTVAGAGSGAGSINIFYENTYSFNGQTKVVGGLHGTLLLSPTWENAFHSGDGGAGSTTVMQIEVS